MAWEIQETTGLIMNDNVVVGSIVNDSEGLSVEILWNGQGGDLTYKAYSRQEAEGFIRGAEAMLARWLPPPQGDDLDPKEIYRGYSATNLRHGGF